MNRIKAILNLYENKGLLTKREALLNILKIAYIEAMKEEEESIINILKNTFPIDEYNNN